jgi:hypothetical protein
MRALASCTAYFLDTKGSGTLEVPTLPTGTYARIPLAWVAGGKVLRITPLAWFPENTGTNGMIYVKTGAGSDILLAASGSAAPAFVGSHLDVPADQAAVGQLAVKAEITELAFGVQFTLLGD